MFSKPIVNLEKLLSNLEKNGWSVTFSHRVEMSEPERKLKVSDGQISPPGLDQEPDDHETKVSSATY